MSAIEDMERATRALTQIMARETAALRARDLPAAAALAPAKIAALEEFVKARAGLEPETARAMAGFLADLVHRLRESVEENRAVLENGIALQGRVLEVIAKAAAPAASPSAYGRPTPGVPVPLALSLRA